MNEKDWSLCRLSFDDFDCVEDLGFGAEDAGSTQRYYKPGEFPKNGTDNINNTNGVISTPINGASFTWNYSTDVHIVTVRSTEYVGTATITETQASTADSRSDATQINASQTDSGARSTSTGKGHAPGVPFWRIIGLAVQLGLVLIW